MRTSHRRGRAAQKTVGSLVVVVGAVVGGLIGTEIVSSAGRALLGGDGDYSVDATLVEVANEMNASLPMMIDANTRLDSTLAMPGKRLCYVYTVVGVDPLPSGAELAERLRPLLLNNYRTAPEMATLREFEVTLVYKYRDEQGNSLTTFEIAVADL